MIMNDCDRILQQLNDYLDGAADVDVDGLRHQARADRDCLSLFDALLEVHALFAAAPMARTEHDFAVSVTAALVRRERRQKLALAGVIVLGALTMLLPLLTLVWMGVAFLLQPGIFSRLITGVLAFISDAAAIAMAMLTAVGQLPPAARLALFTALSLSFLLLALASANRAHPELIRASN